VTPEGFQLARLAARAAAGEARAEAEAERARRALRLSELGSPLLREVHARVAEMHRRNADLHRATARLHQSLLHQMQYAADAISDGHRLVRAVAEVTQAPSSAILLLAGDGSTAEVLTMGTVAEAAQDLELVHGEGPMHTATAADRAVDVEGDAIGEAWPMYAPPVIGLGVRIIVAAPLRIRHDVVGAVGLFDPTDTAVRGPGFQQIVDGLAQVLLERAATEGIPTAVFGAKGMSEIHQACGMVAVEADCDVATALALIRARAFADDVRATTVARRVLSGELRLSI
jgi:hypothetical protein